MMGFAEAGRALSLSLSLSLFLSLVPYFMLTTILTTLLPYCSSLCLVHTARSVYTRL